MVLLAAATLPVASIISKAATAIATDFAHIACVFIRMCDSPCAVHCEKQQERGDALSSLFYSTLGLADTLVRSSDSLAQRYGTALYILMFKEFRDPFLKSVST
jgi:hypothetical protein